MRSLGVTPLPIWLIGLFVLLLLYTVAVSLAR
jgi:hypothetical protein